MDKIVHFEIPIDDKERAMKFYSETFGWKLNDMPEMKYTICVTGSECDENGMPKEPGFINGGMFERTEDLKNPMITIDVESVDGALKKIEENGGIIVRSKTQVGDMGYIAYFKDSEGNVVGLWETIKKQ